MSVAALRQGQFAGGRQGIDVTKETTFVARPTAMLAMAALSAGMTVLSFLIAWPVLDDVRPGSFQQFAGWVGVILFGVVTALILARSFGTNRPTLTLSPQGFIFSGASPDLIPWSAVTGVKQWRAQKQSMLVVGVTEDIWRSPNIKRIARWTRSANQRLGVDGLAIPSTGMPVKFDVMMAAFLTYLNAYAKR